MNSTPLLFKGRAVSSQHAGGADLTTVAYNSDGSTSVTDARGSVHGYGFSTQFGLVKPTARESRLGEGLRGLTGARDEFHLAAIRRLAYAM
jgi:hypothetical protein